MFDQKLEPEKCDSKFIPSSLFSFGVKLRLEGDVNGITDVMKWSVMKLKESAREVDIPDFDNAPQKTLIKNVADLMQESKKELEAQVLRMNGKRYIISIHLISIHN